MAKIDSQTNQIQEITSKLEEGVRNVFESGAYEEYLKTFSKFHQYSFNNVILMQMQYPVQHVASYIDWKRKFKRNVKKGQKGIKILVPIKKKIIVSNDSVDPDNEEPVTIDHLYFRLGTVFDISMTEGEPLPSLTKNLETNSDLLKTALDSIINSFNIPITISANKEQFGNANGYYVPSTQEIFIRDDLSDHHKLKTLIHELGHYMSETFYDVKDMDRDSKEVIAESTAFVTLELLKNKIGIDLSSDSYSFGYIAGWSKTKDLKDLKSTLSTIQEISTKLFDQIIPSFQTT